MPAPDFASHYYLPDRGPFRSLSDLRDGSNNPIFVELLNRHKAAPGYRRQYGADYIERRRDVEGALRDLFIGRGGNPVRGTPYYLTLGDCSWFKNLNDQHLVLRVKLASLNPATTSITFPDSFMAMTRSDKPYYRKVYLLDEIPHLYETYSLPRDGSNVPYDSYWRTDFEIYAEVQIWEEPVFPQLDDQQ